MQRRPGIALSASRTAASSRPDTEGTRVAPAPSGAQRAATSLAPARRAMTVRALQSFGDEGPAHSSASPPAGVYAKPSFTRAVSLASCSCRAVRRRRRASVSRHVARWNGKESPSRCHASASRATAAPGSLLESDGLLHGSGARAALEELDRQRHGRRLQIEKRREAPGRGCAGRPEPARRRREAHHARMDEPEAGRFGPGVVEHDAAAPPGLGDRPADPQDVDRCVEPGPREPPSLGGACFGDQLLVRTVPRHADERTPRKGCGERLVEA